MLWKSGRFSRAASGALRVQVENAKATFELPPAVRVRLLSVPPSPLQLSLCSHFKGPYVFRFEVFTAFPAVIVVVVIVAAFP